MELQIPAHQLKFFKPGPSLPAFGQKDPYVPNEHLQHANLDEG